MYSCVYMYTKAVKWVLGPKHRPSDFFLFHSALQIMVLNIHFFSHFFIAQCSGTYEGNIHYSGPDKKHHNISPSLPEGIGISRGWGFWGFAKSRPVVQRPTARNGPVARRPEGPAARGPRPATARRPAARGSSRPGGPRPAARGPRWPSGLEAGGPVLIFNSFFVQR